MLLPKDTNPKNSIYFYGAIVCNKLEEVKEGEIDFLDLFTKSREESEISLQSFVLTLDWLFILGLIKLDKFGLIKKCF
ncbi:ABC-three component system middle component 6 [Hymenobacter qilianensis]|uniref:ABC-three component system middle component 6 n=1 Tax=Hymenobacter qilianensis TaxID=1385715 RepID=UPI0035711E86